MYLWQRLVLKHYFQPKNYRQITIENAFVKLKEVKLYSNSIDLLGFPKVLCFRFQK